MVFGWRHLDEPEMEAIVNGIVRNRVLGGPYHLEIHPTNKCNANCFFCFTDHYRENQVLPFELIEKVLRAGRREGLKLIRLAGGGESLIHPDIDKILDEIAECGMRLSDVTTNGLTLTRHASTLVDIGSDFIYVSLNESNPGSYAETMRVAPKMFTRAVEGVSSLVSARNAAPNGKRPVVALQFFLHGANHHLLEEMYSLACSLDVDEIYIRSLMGMDDAHRIRPDHLLAVKENIGRIIRDDCENRRYRLRFNLAQEADLNEYIVNLQRELVPHDVLNLDFPLRNPRHEYCVMGWFGATLTATGMVYPCCVFQEKDGKEMGDITRQGLHEVWHGERYRKYRTLMRRIMLLRGDMRYSQRCHGCIDPMCIGNFSCYFTYNLADAAFYDRLSRTLEMRFPGYERLYAKGHDMAIRKYHKIRHGLDLQ